MKTYFISSTATVSCYTSVEADSEEEAFEIARDLPNSEWQYEDDGIPNPEYFQVENIV